MLEYMDFVKGGIPKDKQAAKRRSLLEPDQVARWQIDQRRFDGKCIQLDIKAEHELKAIETYNDELRVKDHYFRAKIDRQTKKLR